MTDHIQPQSESDDEINLLDLLLIVVDNLRILILIPLGVGVLALGISFLITPTFTAKTVILTPQEQVSAASALVQSLGGLGGLAGAAVGLKNPADQFVSMLKSREVRDALIDRYKLLERYDVEYKQNAREVLDAVMKISAGKDGLIYIDANDKDPKFAAELANAHVRELDVLLGRLSISEAKNRRQFFEHQLQVVTKKMILAESALKASGVNSSALKSTPDYSLSSVAQLQAQIASQEIRVSGMRGYLADSSPEMRQSLIVLSALRAQLNKLEKSVPSINDKEDSYVARYREFKYQETLFEIFSKQYELARADEARNSAGIQIIDLAVVPELKSKPKKGMIAIVTTLLTGILVFMFVFIRSIVYKAKTNVDVARKINLIKHSWYKVFGREKWLNKFEQ